MTDVATMYVEERRHEQVQYNMLFLKKLSFFCFCKKLLNSEDRYWTVNNLYFARLRYDCMNKYKVACTSQKC